MTNQPRRIVNLEPGYDTSDYAWFQANYLHTEQKRLFPNTDVYIGDELVFQTNSFGCKGSEPEPGRRVLGIFGDSVVQGGKMTSFVDHVHVPGFATLNGGVEGSTLERTVDRFVALNERLPMDCVALHTGWHNLTYGKNTEAFWTEQLDRVEGAKFIAHFTLVADIIPAVIEAGYEEFYCEGVYWKIEHFAEDKQTLIAFYDRILAFNEFIRAYCERRGRILIDIAPVLAPRAFTDISTKFFDLVHPRQGRYWQIGEAIAVQLAPHIAPGMGPKLEPPSPAPRPNPNGKPESSASRIGRNYPLW